MMSLPIILTEASSLHDLGIWDYTSLILSLGLEDSWDISSCQNF